MKPPNTPFTPNPAIAPWSQVGSRGRGIGDRERLAILPHYTVQSLRSIGSFILCTTVVLVVAGCSHLSLPSASRYRVVCGQATYVATSV